ncbi:MAG: peptide deformylase [Pseudorhizobium sp.]
MALLPILRYPDVRLSQQALPVTKFDAALQLLAGDLLQTMRAAPGVGITASHVGISQRIMVLELPEQDPQLYCNPQILSSSQQTILHTEGSVSMPGVTEEVERPAAIRFRYQRLDGSVYEEDADGFHAVCIQHEIDQLDGIFWLKRLSRLKRERLIRRWQKQSSG